MIALDAIGQRYGLRPSSLIRTRNPFAALTLDLAVRNAGVEEENRQAREAARKAGVGGRR